MKNILRRECVEKDREGERERIRKCSEQNLIISNMENTHEYKTLQVDKFFKKH